MVKIDFNNIIVLLFVIVLFFVLGYISGCKDNKTIIDDKETDTIYNPIVLDSIEYNINKKDSTIIELKKKFEYEKDKALNATDSDAINQFKSLAGSDI